VQVLLPHDGAFLLRRSPSPLEVLLCFTRALQSSPRRPWGSPSFLATKDFISQLFRTVGAEEPALVEVLDNAPMGKEIFVPAPRPNVDGDVHSSTKLKTALRVAAGMDLVLMVFTCPSWPAMAPIQGCPQCRRRR
jgi:hypothetical protein